MLPSVASTIIITKQQQQQLALKQVFELISVSVSVSAADSVAASVAATAAAASAASVIVVKTYTIAAAHARIHMQKHLCRASRSTIHFSLCNFNNFVPA